MKKHPSLIRAFAAVAAAGVISISAHAQCNINMSSTQQTIDGFGFSSAWCGTLSSAWNNSAYGTLGFSLLRIQIDPGGDWGAEAANAAAAHAGGAKVLGSSWSAPGSWTTTGGAYSGELLPEHYADYANWLQSAVTAHKLDWVSPANEPDLGWMSWTCAELTSWIGQYGGSLGAPLLAPESCWFADDYGDPMLDDAAAGPNITIYGGHLYGASPSVHQDALNKGKHCWVTEKYFDNSETDMGACISFAQEVSDCMNDQMSAYIYWNGLCGSDGSIYKNGYTMGQFSKWVRPGSSRVSSDYNPQSGVSVTAYRVNNKTVIVVINANTYSVSQQFAIQNGNAATMEGYRTSSSEGMADIGNFNVSGGSFTANLPAQSVTTFVQTSSTSPSTTSGGTYKLIAKHSGKALDAYGAGTANGTQIIQWTYGAAANQQWTISSVGNNLYSIIGVGSGKCVDINGAGTANGTKVQLWDYQGGSNQKFAFNPTTNGYYEISPSHATSSCLDVTGVSTSDGATVQLWTYGGGQNQQWLVQPVDGTVKLVSQLSSKALDAYGAGTANGTQLVQWTYGGGSNQKWTLTDTGSGNYKIIGVQSGKAVDIYNGGTANGSKVELWTYGGGSMQLFKLTSTEVGQFRISPNCAPGSCLDVNGYSTSDGANVQLWQWNNQANQKWATLAP